MSQADEPADGQSVALETLVAILQSGTLELQGLMPWSSNYTFLATIADAASGLVVPVVYKPQRGENPLWDFPQGTLYKREAAAFVVSNALGWDLVPPTVVRDGPHGVGSAQLCIAADYEQHYFTLGADHEDTFKRMALFDAVINNADRKGGHVLIDDQGRIWAIDHGISFHTEYKLRTVIWEWAGQPIPDAELADLRAFATELADPAATATTALAALIYPREIRALRERVEDLIKRAVFPVPRGPRSTPWPPV